MEFRTCLSRGLKAISLTGLRVCPLKITFFLPPTSSLLCSSQFELKLIKLNVFICLRFNINIDEKLLSIIYNFINFSKDRGARVRS